MNTSLRKSVETAANIITITSLVTIAFCVVLIVLGSFTGCAAVKPACAVIDAAHAACAVITYQDEAGNTRVVRVTQDELVAFTKNVEASRSDAGAP